LIHDVRGYFYDVNVSLLCNEATLYEATLYEAILWQGHFVARLLCGKATLWQGTFVERLLRGKATSIEASVLEATLFHLHHKDFVRSSLTTNEFM